MATPAWKKMGRQPIGKPESDTTAPEISYDYGSRESRRRSRGEWSGSDEQTKKGRNYLIAGNPENKILIDRNRRANKPKGKDKVARGGEAA